MERVSKKALWLRDLPVPLCIKYHKNCYTEEDEEAQRAQRMIGGSWQGQLAVGRAFGWTYGIWVRRCW